MVCTLGTLFWRETLPKKRVSLQVRNLTKFCTVACNLTIEKSFTEANKYKHFWITVVFSRGNHFSRWMTWIPHSSRVGLPQLFLVLILRVGCISGTNCNLDDVNSPYTFEKSPVWLCGPLCCVFWAGMRKVNFYCPFSGPQSHLWNEVQAPYLGILPLTTGTWFSPTFPIYHSSSQCFHQIGLLPLSILVCLCLLTWQHFFP